MLNVKGVCSITKINEVSAKCLSATLYFGTKDQNDEWENHFFNSMIVGDAVTHIIQHGIKNKDKVEIEGILKTRTYEYKGVNRIDTQLIIFSVKKYEKKEGASDEKGKSKFDR